MAILDKESHLAHQTLYQNSPGLSYLPTENNMAMFDIKIADLAEHTDWAEHIACRVKGLVCETTEPIPFPPAPRSFPS